MSSSETIVSYTSMRPHRFFRASLVFGLLSVCVAPHGTAKNARPNRPRLVVPPIARIGGAVVGVTTMEKLEKRFGKGRMLVGGHAHGARAWRDEKNGWCLFADGFYYEPGGRVLDQLVLSSSVDFKEPSKVSVVHLDREALAFMGYILLGMSREGVCKALNGRVHVRGNDVVLTARGYAPLGRKHEPYTTWTATLSFQKDRLTEIAVGCG